MAKKNQQGNEDDKDNDDSVSDDEYFEPDEEELEEERECFRGDMHKFTGTLTRARGAAGKGRLHRGLCNRLRPTTHRSACRMTRS